MEHIRRMPRARPQARAVITGGPGYSALRGIVDFYQTARGVLVAADISGLPTDQSTKGSGVFGFHIHTGNECAGDTEDPFARAGGHYNPANTEHPYHAGDLPPLFEAGGRAYLTMLTGRFTLKEVLGRAVIIHAMPDDFHTQPSGDSGMKIACGIIKKL